MKQEVSAGGLVVCKINREWHVLLIKDMNSNWTFPKGLVERGEDALTAARREIAEEVGVRDIFLTANLSPITYMYRREGLINKTVYYFLFSSSGKEILKGQKEEGISDVRWIPLSEATEIIGYSKTNKKLLEEVDSILRARSPRRVEK